MKRWLIAQLRANRPVLLFILLMLVFRSAVADWNDVPSGSMQPTIFVGDRILVDRMAYDLRLPFTHYSLFRRADPARGDIVVFDSRVSGRKLVKRVVGVPGDAVAMRNNMLILNGRAVTYHGATRSGSSLERVESLADQEHLIRVQEANSTMASFATVMVPTDHYLVLGDNRDNSADSRVIGFVPREEIVGRASTVLVSLDHENYFLPRRDRIFKPL